MAFEPPVVRVGVSVFVLESSQHFSENPCFLIGKRKGSHSAGTYALPGGHVEFGETPEETAARELMEETSLKVSNIRFLTATNDYMPADSKHYITLFMVCVREASTDLPKLLEPNKCEGWEWVSWDDMMTWVRREEEARDDEVLEKKLFPPLLNLVRQRPGVVPTVSTEPAKSTVIVGTGIIGLSTAYYLSESTPAEAHNIHLVEASPDLFASASGFAAGFLAADWFSPPLVKLGQLSFKLHKELAETHNGHERWGYSRSTGTSLAETSGGSNGGSGADWLREGASRAIAAENTQLSSGHAPPWLKSRGDLDVLSNGDTTAQVNPRSLCDFLLSICLARGVKLHQPARPTRVSRSASGAISSIEILNTSTAEFSSLPCTSLVVTAGAWSSKVLNTLFPKSHIRSVISALAGHSLVLRSAHWPPRSLNPTDLGATRQECHAVFTTEAEGGYSPEIFSRMPNGEVYLAGLNSSSYPLPNVANERKIDPKSIEVLRKTAKRLCGKDVQVVREGVCWRPVTKRGTPIIAEMTAVMEEAGKGVFLAAGHGAWGISLSLGTGYAVAGMVEGRDMKEYVGRLGFWMGEV